jgi:hypothetical protein
MYRFALFVGSQRKAPATNPVTHHGGRPVSTEDRKENRSTLFSLNDLGIGSSLENSR